MAGLISLLRKGAREIESKLETLRIDVLEVEALSNEKEFLKNTSLECQFFPEELSDSKSAEYTTIECLGGSHPLYMWVYSSERTISFPIVLLQEVKNYSFVSTGKEASLKYIRTVDIRYIVKWLRRLTYPYYRNGFAVAPPLLRLYIPNLAIGYYPNTNILYVYMTKCDVTYEDLYPDNTPRIATVNVEFVETSLRPYEVEIRNRVTDFKDLALPIPTGQK